LAVSYREFENTDPPLIAEIWRRQKRFRGIVDRITHQMVDDLILGKPFFDAAGFTMALDGNEPIGFVHAGFCPTADGANLDPTQGVLSQLRIVERDDTPDVAQKLVERAEAYLRERGAQIIHAGGKFPEAPCYQGLYGGSRIPGVLQEDALMTASLAAAGFLPQSEVLIFQRRLAGFRPMVDRQQMTVRRQFQLQSDSDPPFSTWWEACTMGFARRTGFELTERSTLTKAASLTFWDIEPLANSWGVRAMGMNDLQVANPFRRCGLATFLLGESMRHLAQEGVGLIEVQTLADDAASCGVFTKHGFELVGKGSLLTKAL
jgi:ribosomal protein S18 acetylase RimI-like enzyme